MVLARWGTVLEGVAVCCVATAEHDVDQTKSITSPVRSRKKVVPKRAEGKWSNDDTIGHSRVVVG